MEKPQQILELEKIIGREISEVSFNKMNWMETSYSLSEEDKIIGLSLYSCKLHNLYFLTDCYYQNLKILFLTYTEIVDVTPVKNLTQLTKLGLGCNKITDISPIQKLANLNRLSLVQNQIINLPVWILDFDLEIIWEWEWNRKGIFLGGNPFQSPPPEIIMQGNATIKAYFDALKQNLGRKVNLYMKGGYKEVIISEKMLTDGNIYDFGRLLNELKVLFIGEGGAGKTSLSKLLRDQPFDPHENQTHGINIDDWKVGDITAHLWDFGGQEILRATHKFFLSKRSLYVLVLDNREKRDEETWLKRIESFGGNSPILIVLNKCDQDESYDLDRKELVRRYSGLQTQDFYFVSCANGQGMEAFKQGLIAAFKRVELINSVLPESWFQVKTALEQQQRQQHYISYNEFQKICFQQQIEETETQDILARLLHDLGVSVHFEDLALLDTHVLEPKWITEGVYKIITSPQLTEQQGVLYLTDLSSILNPRSDLPGFKNLEGLTTAEYIYPPTKYAYLLELMKKFELSYRLNDNAVLIPQLLKPEEPAFAFDDSGQVLRFQILYDYLDDSIMPRFIVALHQDIDNRIQWRKGVLLKNAGFKSQAVVRVNYQDRLLIIMVKGEQKRDYFAVIRKALHDIHASFEWKKTPIELVPLPDNPAFTVEYEELIGYELDGDDKYRVGKLRKIYSVSQLLDGIEKPEQRKQSGDIHYHSHNHHGDYNEEKKAVEIKSLTIDGGNQQFANNIENYNGDKKMSEQKIEIGAGATIGSGSFNVDSKIEHSFNSLQESKTSNEVKELLAQLLNEIKGLTDKVEPENIQTVEEMVDDVQDMIDELNEPHPRRRIILNYLNTLKNKAVIAAVSTDVITTIIANFMTIVPQLPHLL